MIILSWEKIKYGFVIKILHRILKKKISDKASDNIQLSPKGEVNSIHLKGTSTLTTE